jgi:HSP20 family protein
MVCNLTQSATSNWGALRRVGTIDGESQSFAGAIPLAQRLLFFIIGDYSPVIRYEPGDINFQSNEEEKTMKSQQGIQPTKQQAPASPIFVEAEKLFQQMKELSQSVARRAYGYFEARGREFGHDLEDWFRAESELMVRVPVEVKEAGDQIIVRAEIPGFAANEIKISVEPQRLVIGGKSEKTTEEMKEQTSLSEFSSNQFCRELRLPAEVEPDKTTAVLKDGVLELVFAKAAESKPVSVEVKPE